MVWTTRDPLDEIVLQYLPGDFLLKRCYQLHRGPLAFWPAIDQRFAAGPDIGTLFTGDSDTAAVCETMVRDPQPIRGTNQIVLPYDQVRKRGLATLRLRRPAHLISLRRPAVSAVIHDALHLEDVRLLLETAKDYTETVRFARALLQQAPALDVLSWPSRRADGHTVYCFYNRALAEGDFEIVEQIEFKSAAGYARLEAAVRAAGLELVRAPRPETSSDVDP